MKEINLARPFILALALNNYDPFFGAREVNNLKCLEERIYRQVYDYIKTSTNHGVLVLTGGEPFLDWRLPEILSLAQTKGWAVSVDTWGGFKEPPSSLNLIQQVRLRLLSLNPERHDKLSGKEKNHQELMAFGKWLAEKYAGEKILVFPVYQENNEEVAAVLSWCQKFNFMANIFIVPRQHKYALEYKAYQTVIRQLGALPLQRVIIDIPLLGLSGWPNLCSGGRLAMFIGTDGEVKPCPYFPYPLCWLEKDVLKAWVALQEKAGQLNKNCSSCGYFPSCGGGCLANKTDTGKDYYCPYNENEVYQCNEHPGSKKFNQVHRATKSTG